MQTTKVVEIKIGDVVRVVNVGKHYSLYKEMAKIMNARFWRSGNETRNGEIGRVTGVAPHEDFVETTVCLVKKIDEDYEFLIGDDGLEKASGIEIQKYYNNKRRCKL